MTVPDHCTICGYQGTDAEVADHLDHGHNTESQGWDDRGPN